MYGKTAVVVVATATCVTSLTFSVFRTGVRADDLGQRARSRRLVSARPVVKPLNVRGPFLMTGKDLIDLPPAGEPDESLAGHDFEITQGAGSIRDLTTRLDGDRPLKPFITTFDPNIGATDPQIAVSATHILISGWDRWTVFTKDGTKVTTVKAAAFFADLLADIDASLNVPNIEKYGIDHFFDTRLIYDDYRHRFWVATLAKQKSTDSGINKGATNEDLTYRRAKVLVGVSATDDPTGDWHRYWWDGIIDDGICNAPDEPPQTVQCPGSLFSPGDGHDYSFIGVSKWHFMETNITTDYAYLSVVSAEDLASGVRPPADAFPAWQYGQFRYSDDGAVVVDSILQPAVHHGPESPGGSWLLNVRTEGPNSHVGKVHLWFLNANTSPPVLGTAALSFTAGYKGTAEQAPHPSIPTPRRLLTFPGHFVMKAVWRDGDLYAVVPDCRQWSGATECMAAIKLLRFGAFGDTGRPVINRTFGGRNVFFDPPDEWFSYFMPAIEVNGLHNMAMVYQRSGPTIWPEVRLSLRLEADIDVRPSIPVHLGEFTVGCDLSDEACADDKEGEEPKKIRSIDNSGMAVDPFDDEAIWMIHAYGIPPDPVGEFIKGRWKTIVGKVFGRPHPDLTFRRARVINQPLVSGGPIAAEATVANQGDGSADNLTVTFYLSSYDPVFGTVRLGERKVASMVPGGLVDIRLTSSIPKTLTPGRYYLLAAVEQGSGNAEYSVRNNSVASEPVDVTRPTARQ